MQTNRMVVSPSNSSAIPSAVAVSSETLPDDSSNSATLVTLILLGAVFVVLVIALLIYRQFRRTSGAIWISKVCIMLSSHTFCTTHCTPCIHSFRSQAIEQNLYCEKVWWGVKPQNMMSLSHRTLYSKYHIIFTTKVYQLFN